MLTVHASGPPGLRLLSQEFVPVAKPSTICEAEPDLDSPAPSTDTAQVPAANAESLAANVWPKADGARARGDVANITARAREFLPVGCMVFMGADSGGKCDRITPAAAKQPLAPIPLNREQSCPT
jgi:hypothetical protein